MGNDPFHFVDTFLDLFWVDAAKTHDQSVFPIVVHIIFAQGMHQDVVVQKHLFQLDIDQAFFGDMSY